jgi:hypothetical protein
MKIECWNYSHLCYSVFVNTARERGTIWHGRQEAVWEKGWATHRSLQGRVPLDKNEGVVKVHESGHVPQAR